MMNHDKSAERNGSRVTGMSGFLKTIGIKVLKYPALVSAVPFLLYWSIWSTFSAVSGCVVPVSPKFEDPPKAPNFPPFIVDSFPHVGMPVIAPQTFELNVADVNPADRLYVRWVSDYPLYVQARSRLLASSDLSPGLVQYSTGTANADAGASASKCMNFVVDDGTEHRLTVIISDRPFVAPQDAPDPLLRFSAVPVNAQTTPIVATWNITCP